jgi:hypothetical protein
MCWNEGEENIENEIGVTFLKTLDLKAIKYKELFLENLIDN